MFYEIFFGAGAGIVSIILISPTFRREIKEYFDLNKRNERARKNVAS